MPVEKRYHFVWNLVAVDSDRTTLVNYNWAYFDRVVKAAKYWVVPGVRPTLSL